ncbi:CaiB/BaiF CoA transferase family protein [Halomarina ordinaria]|uniref:CaiB/BaiF CoA transferase family protein n=1 Tax=Halomarina ordinaria TaxID=3033939 RepID=A0ABD5UJ63_9EURY|nr:CaiB/BaiF CoA-transferase family protein [Halomarina sp. PSRA2]
MQPFEGVDVLDLTQSIAGPVSTAMLASMGANVVKLEPPDGDAFRGMLGGAMFTYANRGGKRSIAVDLKTEEGATVARDLARRADVVVESFRPGVVEKFGLDYETTRAENPGVVYCSVSGFGQGGPYRDYPAYDPVVQAASGLMSVIGYPDRPPVRIGASVIDCGTGANAAFMMASALRERERTGEGEYIDMSLFDVAVSWMGYWLAYYDSVGETPRRAGSRLHGFAPNNVFEAGDGDALYMSAISDHLYERVCRAVDREDLLDDERFGSPDDRWDNREVLEAELAETFARYERDALVERLAAAGVPTGPLQGVTDLLDDDHLAARDLVTETENVERDRRVRTAAYPLRTREGLPDLADPPSLGEHTREVLADLGVAESEVDRLLEEDVVRDA